MTRLLLVPVLFIYACVFAGAYGALHNQVSYTVSPEYFTKYKFVQFDIDDSVSERAGASIVGWHASWWMGIAIGIILIPLGLLARRDPREYFWFMIKIFWLVAVTTLAIGLTALGVSYLVVDPDTVAQFTRFDREITDNAAFARAGTMHNFSYLGGLFGIVTGAVAILRKRNPVSN